jgi:hypothetical protein
MRAWSPPACRSVPRGEVLDPGRSPRDRVVPATLGVTRKLPSVKPSTEVKVLAEAQISGMAKRVIARRAPRSGSR